MRVLKKITDASKKYILYREIVRNCKYAVHSAYSVAVYILAPAFPFILYILQSSRRREMTARRIILRAWKKRSNDCISEVKLQLDPSEASGGCPITSQLTPQKNQRSCYRGTFLRQSVIFAADV